MRRYYGVDLRDLWRDESGVTPRLVLWLVGHLPQESATVAEIRGGPEHRAWGVEAQLLADVVNLLAAANYQRARKPMRKPLVTPPKQRHRPGQQRGRIVRIKDIIERQRQQLERDHNTGRG